MKSNSYIKNTQFLSQKPEDFDSKRFFKQSIYLMIPVIFQNLISNMINLLDTIMIERYGQGYLAIDALAAVGYANQLYFLFTMICFGFCSGGGVFLAQYFGIKDYKRIKSTFGFVTGVALILSAVFFVIAFFFPLSFLHIFVANERTYNLAESYLKIVAFSYFFNAISITLSISSRSVQQANIPTIASVIGLIVNFVGNYTFIFGNFGMPRLGVEGAAIGTVIARIIECFIMIFLIYWKKELLAGTLSELKNFNLNFVKSYIKISIPVVLNESAWAFGVFLYNVAYSNLGESAIASVQIANVITSLLSIFLFGIGNACGAMVGEQLGKNKKQMAAFYGLLFGRLSILTGVIVGLIMVVASFFLRSFLHLDTVTLDYIQKILWVKAFWLPLASWNITLIIGTLRAGGDTKYSLLIDLCGVWLIGVPLAFLGVLILKLPIYWIIFIVGFEDVFKVILGLKRFYSESWLKQVISHENETKSI